jgi:hypothetical protein
MRESRFWQEALARAATKRSIGWLRSPRRRTATAGTASRDRPVTEALFAEDISGGK